jgi:hypothetical protein
LSSSVRFWGGEFDDEDDGFGSGNRSEMARQRSLALQTALGKGAFLQWL